MLIWVSMVGEKANGTKVGEGGVGRFRYRNRRLDSFD